MAHHRIPWAQAREGRDFLFSRAQRWRGSAVNDLGSCGGGDAALEKLTPESGEGDLALDGRLVLLDESEVLLEELIFVVRHEMYAGSSENLPTVPVSNEASG